MSLTLKPRPGGVPFIRIQSFQVWQSAWLKPISRVAGQSSMRFIAARPATLAVQSNVESDGCEKRDPGPLMAPVVG
jgi:hypothetical protein